MLHRAADYATAKEVCVAVELARFGATGALIERVTGFGTRWVRGIVREHGGAPAVKAKDVGRWLDQDPDRLLQARYATFLFEQLPLSKSIGSRVLAAYRAYRNVPPDPVLLGITEFAQIIDLYQSHKIWQRLCPVCESTYLVYSEQGLCPQCRIDAQTFCRSCQAPLPAGLKRKRTYCDACAPRSIRNASRERDRYIQIDVRDEACEPLVAPLQRTRQAIHTTLVNENELFAASPDAAARRSATKCEI